ncbi:MAG: hypothetical protein GY716_02720 [bacterium]|nr:hypothetical protein [bacterium]
MRRAIRHRLAVTLLVASCGSVFAGETRFVRTGGTARPVDWLSISGNRVIAGSNDGLREGDVSSPALEGLGAVGETWNDGLLHGTRLFVSDTEGDLHWIDLAADGARTRPLAAEMNAAASVRFAAAGDRLVVTRSGAGLELLDIPARHQGHHGHPSEPRFESLGALTLRREMLGVAANPTTAFVGVADRRVVEIDLSAADAPRLGREVRIDVEPRALAASGTTLYVLGDSGLQLVRFPPSGPAEVSEVFEEIRGTDLALRGRVLHVVELDGTPALYRDTTSAGMGFPVAVNNNFFEPGSMVVQVGDTVDWTNNSGFHNVFSCTTTQLGCAGDAANELFVSGSPAPPFWEYGHTFLLPGENPYVCQAHVPGMVATVSVEGVPIATPPVPDGTFGSPMTVEKLATDGSALRIDWDATTCTGNVDYSVVVGGRVQLPTAPGGSYGVFDAECNLGPPPYTWTGVPPASFDPGGVIWWLVLTTDGQTTEGSWGTDSLGNERDGPGAGGSSSECLANDKDLSDACP